MMANTFSYVIIGCLAVIIITYASIMFYTQASSETGTPVTTTEFATMQTKFNSTFTDFSTLTQKNMTNALNSNSSLGTAGSFIINFAGVWASMVMAFNLVTYIPDLFITAISTFKILGAPLLLYITAGVCAIVGTWIVGRVINFGRGTDKW